MASTSRRATRSSVRASPAPSADEDEPAAAVTPRAAAPSRRRTDGVRQTPLPATSSTLAATSNTPLLGTASVSRPAALRRRLGKADSAMASTSDVFGAGAGQVASLVAATRARRSTSRLSAAGRPTSTLASSSTAAGLSQPVPATVEEEEADETVLGADKLREADGELESAVATPDALSSILGHSTRLLSHYFGTLVRPMPENLPDVYYPDMLEALSVVAPAQALDAAPYQLPSPAQRELRVANAAIFLRGVWLTDDELADGGVVRPEKVRDFADAWRVFLDVFAGPDGVALDEDVLGLLLDLSTQLYLLKVRTTVSRSTRARNTLLEQLFPPALVSSWAGEGAGAARWRLLCQQRVKEMKSYEVEELRVRHPYFDFRNDIVAFCKSTIETGAEEVEGASRAGTPRSVNTARRSFGGLEARRSSSGPGRGRLSDPVRRPRYTADLPPPLHASSLLRQARQSLPAGFSTSTSQTYTPPHARQPRGKTPVVQIPPDTESSADEAEEEDELVEAALSEIEVDTAEEPSDGESASDEDLESADETEGTRVKQNVADQDPDQAQDGAASAADGLATSDRPTPRKYRSREGKQLAQASLDEDPAASASAPIEGAEDAAGSMEDEEEVALLTQVNDTESQPLATGQDDVPWDDLFSEDESPPLERRSPSHAEESPKRIVASARNLPPRAELPDTADAAVAAPALAAEAAVDDSARPELDFTQVTMGGGDWTPEPEQEPVRQTAQASAAATSSARLPATKRARPSRAARPSLPGRADFDSDDSSDEDGPDQLPLLPPRSVNRHSPPMPFDPPSRVAPSGPAARVATSPPPPAPSPASGSSSYARRFWSDEETLYLVKKAMRVPSNCSNAYARLDRLYGTNGTRSQKLAGRTNGHIKDKLRQYLSTTYATGEVPAGLVRYLKRRDPRYQPPVRRAPAPAPSSQRPPKKRRKVQREASSSSSEDDGETEEDASSASGSEGA